jgi:hypothetical protein
MTADHYLRLSNAGFAPHVIKVTNDEIVTERHQTLTEWLTTHPGQSARDEMSWRLKKLLLRVHAEIKLCHRDVHLDNVVVDQGGQPLLIDPAYATASVNEHCYDLEGPGPSEVAVPKDHVQQGGLTAGGIWWGSPEKARSLERALGLPPSDE